MKVPDVTQGRKLIFYVKGKDKLLKVDLMKERDKGFMCLIKVMIVFDWTSAESKATITKDDFCWAI